MLEEEKTSARISERVAGAKFKSLDGGEFGNSNGSGLVESVNLVRIRSILSLKKVRNVLAMSVAFGPSGMDLVRFRFSMELSVFQRERGLEEESVTRFVRKVDFALLMSFRTSLH